jgi:hypothetical protein
MTRNHSDTVNAFKIRRLVNTFRARRDCTDCAETAAPVTEDIPVHGLAAPWGLTGDGRAIAKDALTWDVETPIPLKLGHEGPVVGKVFRFRSDNDGVHVEEGSLLATEDEETATNVRRVVEMIETGTVGWSVMLDDEVQEVTHREPVITESSDGTLTAIFRRDDDLSTIIEGRIRHLAFEDTAAYPKAIPRLGLAPVNAAAVTVATYPRAHFEKFVNDSPKDGVPLQVTKDGHVFGQIAGQGCYRDGTGKTCKQYSPDPDREMKQFHTSTVELDDGSRIRVGTLTAGGLHSPLSVGIDGQRQHRENSQTVWAVVRAWDDAYGRLCVSGSVVPGLDQGFVNQAAACPVSIERWPIPGVSGVTLVGALSVPMPAWPVI